MWHHVSESQDQEESREADTGAVGFETFKVPTCTDVPYLSSTLEMQDEGGMLLAN